MATKTPKPSAADRTISLFGSPQASGSEPEREIEVIADDVKDGERKTLEEDADRLRDNAFKGQEWTTKFFGRPEANGNEYRVTRKGDFFYMETLSKKPGTRDAYSYTGVMIHVDDFFNFATPIVHAARALKAEKKSEPND